MMKLYRVMGAPVQIGGGEVIGLTKDQVSPRAHKLEVIRAEEGEDFYVCRPTEPVTFKAGEQLYLDAPPAKAMAERLVPVDGAPDGRIRSEADRKAKAAARKKPSRKPATAGGQQPAQA